MDDEIKRLLDAEQRAQRLVDAALQQQEQMLERAREEAREGEQRFETRMQELRLSFDNKAEEEAARTIAQIERRSKERHEEMQASAEECREDAFAIAIRIITDPERL